MNQGGMGSMGAGGLNPMMGGLNPMLAAGMSGLAGMNGMSAESMNMFAQGMGMGMPGMGMMQGMMPNMMSGMASGGGMAGMASGGGMAGMAPGSGMAPGMAPRGGMVPGGMAPGGAAPNMSMMAAQSGGHMIGSAGAGGGGGAGGATVAMPEYCQKFIRGGNCNFGATCKYIHADPSKAMGMGMLMGDGGPSMMQQQRGGVAAVGGGRVMTPHGGAAAAGGGGGGMAVGGMQKPGGAMPGAMPGGVMKGAATIGVAGAGGPRPPAGAPPPAAAAADKPANFRTRLCEGFMQKGTCRYGTNCTFAHGHHELRITPAGAPRGAGGGGSSAPRAGAAGAAGGGAAGGSTPAGSTGGAQKRVAEQQSAPAAGGDAKRARPAPAQAPVVQQPVVPPEHESLPHAGSMSVEALQRRFDALQQEANRFARDTGMSVAVFAIGGVLSDAVDTADLGADVYMSDVRGKDGEPVLPRLKSAVLKYGTGGVARPLVARAEIVKFVATRGSKALTELVASAAGGGI